MTTLVLTGSSGVLISTPYMLHNIILLATLSLNGFGPLKTSVQLDDSQPKVSFEVAWIVD